MLDLKTALAGKASAVSFSTSASFQGSPNRNLSELATAMPVHSE
jgi:hypothetical protein